MMSVSRREKLQRMLETAPDDHTLRYMLAMEFDKEGDHEGAIDLFNELMEADPPFVPAFLMAGQLYARLDRIHDARKTYTSGIEEAGKQGNAHAAGEMSAFRDDLPD